MMNRQAQLEAIQQQLREQDLAWQRAKEALSRAGDVIIAVPAEMLEALEQPAATAGVVAPNMGVRV